MTHHIPVVRGRRGSGLRSRKAKAAKHIASIAASEQRQIRHHRAPRQGAV